MDTSNRLMERQTSADMVFAVLYDEIVDLSLLPGTKMSEADVAKRFDLSRQPVREAFGRLSKLGLVAIRPQRPTVVRHFSLEDIQNTRFLRAAIELEVLRSACDERDTSFDTHLDACMENQSQAMADNDADKFHAHDYDFHQLLCATAKADFAFEMISGSKAQVDRLCMLSLTSQASMKDLFEDHVEILDAVRQGNKRKVETAIRQHLDRLTPIIKAVQETHPDYFE
ncbi:GntR family transcriptional regulator [Yoonia maricola]|uniref:GntR family transcriptional regulator n=1 Tax=Yoonia maricola TaxID=420999 RepID=A0A2M8W382_9RHOB|nr:GntR family transcriptional regulator [Yoonia maricola]PJI85385.1 GntR family transcriptional regulator [Yoonia maricola]